MNDDVILHSDHLVIFMVYRNPHETTQQVFEIMNLFNREILEKEFNVKLSRNQETLIIKYSEYIIYASIIREFDNKLSWSTTYIKQGNLSQ